MASLFMWHGNRHTLFHFWPFAHLQYMDLKVLDIQIYSLLQSSLFDGWSADYVHPVVDTRIGKEHPKYIPIDLWVLCSNFSVFFIKSVVQHIDNPIVNMHIIGLTWCSVTWTVRGCTISKVPFIKQLSSQPLPHHPHLHMLSWARDTRAWTIL